MRTTLAILFVVLLLQNVSSQSKQQSSVNNKNINHLQYTMEGKSFNIKDSMTIDITVSITSPSIIYNFCSQKKNTQIQFKWEKMDNTEDIGTFKILNGYFIDMDKNIKNKKVSGKVIIKKINYKSHITRTIAVEGLYEMNIKMPDKTQKIINGDFFYEGEYTISL